MSVIWGFLTSKLGGPVAAAVAVALALALSFVWASGKAAEASLGRDVKARDASIVRLTSERDAARGDLTTCRNTRDAQKLELDAQSAAVRRWKGEAEANAARAAAALKDARASRERATRSAGAILAATPGADLCASADAIILGSVK